MTPAASHQAGLGDAGVLGWDIPAVGVVLAATHVAQARVSAFLPFLVVQATSIFGEHGFVGMRVVVLLLRSQNTAGPIVRALPGTNKTIALNDMVWIHVTVRLQVLQLVRRVRRDIEGVGLPTRIWGVCPQRGIPKEPSVLSRLHHQEVPLVVLSSYGSSRLSWGIELNAQVLVLQLLAGPHCTLQRQEILVGDDLVKGRMLGALRRRCAG